MILVAAHPRSPVAEQVRYGAGGQGGRAK